jgi:fido (protein-threonine AMPylation protein)
MNEPKIATSQTTVYDINPRILEKFVAESNRIEGITRNPKYKELEEMHRFMLLEKVTVADLEQFVGIYQPGARLRDKLGLNVIIAGHFPPAGGPDIRKQLEKLLLDAEATSSYRTHINYELLHPFTDGNGRSGRALWAWQIKDLSLGFLHRFYYQTLAFSR